MVPIPGQIIDNKGVHWICFAVYLHKPPYFIYPTVTAASMFLMFCEDQKSKGEVYLFFKQMEEKYAYSFT